MKRTAIATAVALSLGSMAGIAQAAPWTGGHSGTMSSATFTMYDPTGAINNVDAAVTGSIGGGTWSVASTATFFGLLWAAHSGTTFGPGTYTIDTADGGGGPTYTFTVGAGQRGGHILFNWGATTNIDVVNVWNVCSGCGSHTSLDVDGDGTPGIGMIDGPFPGFSANFDFQVAAVPVPAAVWLFGSGLLGLVGVARRKKAA